MFKLSRTVKGRYERMNKVFDKVIKELETNKQNALEIEEYNVWNEAIEIVKKCGVDDVCEWKDGIGIFKIKTSCGNSIDVNYKYEFCPYCGKKIKIVSD